MLFGNGANTVEVGLFRSCSIRPQLDADKHRQPPRVVDLNFAFPIIRTCSILN